MSVAIEAHRRRQGAKHEALAAAPRLLGRAARAADAAARRADGLEHCVVATRAGGAAEMDFFNRSEYFGVPMQELMIVMMNTAVPMSPITQNSEENERILGDPYAPSWFPWLKANRCEIVVTVFYLLILIAMLSAMIDFWIHQ